MSLNKLKNEVNNILKNTDFGNLKGEVFEDFKEKLISYEEKYNKLVKNKNNSLSIDLRDDNIIEEEKKNLKMYLNKRININKFYFKNKFIDVKKSDKYIFNKKDEEYKNNNIIYIPNEEGLCFDFIKINNEYDENNKKEDYEDDDEDEDENKLKINKDLEYFIEINNFDLNLLTDNHEKELLKALNSLTRYQRVYIIYFVISSYDITFNFKYNFYDFRTKYKKYKLKGLEKNLSDYVKTRLKSYTKFGNVKLCCHGIRKKMCDECSPQNICYHNKNKYKCNLCSISLCKNIGCNTNMFKQNNKYNQDYCIKCFLEKNPDYKLNSKEHYVFRFILEKFKNYNWIIDEEINTCEYHLRPDMLLNLYDKVIIIEIDENQHSNYNKYNEEYRLRNIQKSLNKFTIFIRFNTDKNINTASPWKKNNNILILKDEKEWNDRLNQLYLVVKELIENDEIYIDENDDFDEDDNYYIKKIYY